MMMDQELTPELLEQIRSNAYTYPSLRITVSNWTTAFSYI